MAITYEAHHTDNEGNSVGGETRGTGLHIIWQAGPVDDKVGPSGAEPADVVQAVLGRLDALQGSEEAREHLRAALVALSSPAGQLED